MSSTAAQVLFRPFQVKSLALKNRIVMAPMTRSFSPGGVPGPDVAAYYRRRAEHEVGLILSEGTVVDRPGARNDPGIPVFHGQAALAGWRAVIEGVHQAGGRMGPQLWHVGAVQSFQTGWEQDGVESPSGLEAPGKPRGRAMTEEDIADTIAAYARAAADTQALGFDTLEIHGAHGYLLDQFFWAPTNTRGDRYGGETLAERARFAVEVVRAMRAAVGPEFPIILRLSQWKQQDYSARLVQTPEALEAFLKPLADAGVDIFHCSTRRFWEPEFEGSDLNLAGWTRKLTGKPTITVGSVGLDGEFLQFMVNTDKVAQPASLENLLQRLNNDEFDLVAVGRALLVDPDWAQKVREGREQDILPFSRDALMTLV